MIIVFTGNGKGKTSAALGTALRALGWDKKVCIIQFIKGNKEVGEWKFLDQISNLKSQKYSIEIHQFFDDEKLSITEKSILGNKDYKESCEKAWNFAKEIMLSRKYDLVILDEINNALHYDLLNEKDVLNFTRGYSDKNSDLDIIFTGRNASKKLIDIADLVTEMKDIKHPFKKGIKAKEGIDY